MVEGFDEQKTVLRLDLEVSPNTWSNVLVPGSYRLWLQLAAANCKPRNQYVNFTLTGEWHDDEGDMFAKGLSLTPES